jgi:hypothetical protein
MTLAELTQLIGGIGVIASLIYVAIQIRNNARAVRAATYLQISHTQTSALYNMASNVDLAELIVRGGSDFAALKGLDRARFRFHAMFVLTFNQNIFFQHKIGMLTGSDWDSFKYDLVSYFDMGGARAAWPTYKRRFNKEFQVHVDRIIEKIEIEKATAAPPPGEVPAKKSRRRKAAQ